MRERTPPVIVVIRAIGVVLLADVGGIIALALIGREIPAVMGTIAIAAMTGLTGLLTPIKDGWHPLQPHTADRAERAGQAAAAAVMQYDSADTAQAHEQAVRLGNRGKE